MRPAVGWASERFDVARAATLSDGQRPMKAAEPMRPDYSVVVPVYNEAGAVETLALEIAAAFEGRDCEILFVDDASTDNTRAILTGLGARLPTLRVIAHQRNAGQSRAIRSGVLAARADIIVTLDGDGQNDPADIPHLLSRAMAGGAEPALIAGYRHRRRDTVVKRASSRVANAVRSRLLGDDTPDTGCGLKLFRRDAFLELPRFDHMHRFLPALMLRAGGRVESVQVNHRPRRHGRSKYGTLDRLWAGLFDLAGVYWLQRRGRLPSVDVPEQPDA